MQNRYEAGMDATHVPDGTLTRYQLRAKSDQGLVCISTDDEMHVTRPSPIRYRISLASLSS
jgi:hypothetical protein